MTDIVSTDKRSEMMAGIKYKNTKPEILIRKILHKQGFRFRLHQKGLAGKPDLVFKKYNAVIFVHGCFWHGHDCHLFRLPKTRTEFWEEKITTNKKRDENVMSILAADTWRIMEIWECALKGKYKLHLGELATSISEWLVSAEKYKEIIGKNNKV